MTNGRSQPTTIVLVTDDPSQSDTGGPANHRTIDRVTQILEEVVYHPGIGFAELARALDAPKSSVHGFIRGLLAKGWLYESDRGFYLGPAVYGLTLASGRIRAGQVSQADLDALHKDTGMTVFLGVEAGDHLIITGRSSPWRACCATRPARAWPPSPSSGRPLRWNHGRIRSARPC
jgi:hypothetical protein